MFLSHFEGWVKIFVSICAKIFEFPADFRTNAGRLVFSTAEKG